MVPRLNAPFNEGSVFLNDELKKKLRNLRFNLYMAKSKEESEILKQKIQLVKRQIMKEMMERNNENDKHKRR